jgi:hypothetical protein
MDNDRPTTAAGQPLCAWCGQLASSLSMRTTPLYEEFTPPDGGDPYPVAPRHAHLCASCRRVLLDSQPGDLGLITAAHYDRMTRDPARRRRLGGPRPRYDAATTAFYVQRMQELRDENPDISFDQMAANFQGPSTASLYRWWCRATKA